MIARPTARILITIRNRAWTVHQALAELLDNAFGELRGQASHVWITWSPRTRELTVLDNGRGMDDVADLFTLGKGTTSGAGDIGLYGVGGSEASLWLADHADVVTLRDSRVARGKADWAQCIEQVEFPEINNRWRDATVATCPTELLEHRHGTLIRLRIRSRLKIYPELIQERLSRLFAVGLRHGRHLTWSTLEPQVTVQQLHAWSPGDFEDLHTATITLDNGLSATVTAGRVDGLSIANSKLSVNYVYRQIKETSAGFGRPIQGACGSIDLSGSWLPFLTPTKDDIHEDGREFEEELMTRVAEFLKPLVDQLADAKRSRLFTNLKIVLKQKFEIGFKARATATRDRESARSGSSDGSGSSPKPREPRPITHAAQVSITQSTNAELDGKLCTAEIDGVAISCFINKEHPLIINALDAEPINQMLLEQVLIPALAASILEDNALVKFGLLSQTDMEALLVRYGGNIWQVFPHIIRLLTDGVESMAGKEVPPHRLPGAA